MSIMIKRDKPIVPGYHSVLTTEVCSGDDPISILNVTA